MTSTPPLSTGRRRADKRADTRQRLLTVALARFRAHGVERTTVEDITAASGTAKGTFFNYFPTKEHILIAYYDALLASALADAASRRRSHTAAGRVAQLIDACARQVQPDLELARALLRALFSHNLVAAADSVNEETLGHALHEILQEGVKSGEFRANLEFDLFGALVLAVLSTSIQDWVRGGGAFSLRRVVRRKLDVLLRAASA